ncbi:MAG: FixH family protein [Magnetospirillum sp.]|nr:FixH family protein [Magnetospirillum sp.]
MAQNRQRGWWYPFIFVGLFVVVFGVNGTMAYLATSSFTGLWTQHPYEKGLAYNQNLAMARAQDRLGWTVTATATPAGGGRADVAITYQDQNGKPVDGLTVSAIFSRPTVVGHDRQVTLTAKGGGVYGGLVALPLRGEWDADILAFGNGETYQMQRRFVLP